VSEQILGAVGTLYKRRRKNDLIQTYKIMQGIDRLDPDKIFKKMTRRGMTTRANEDPQNIEKGQEPRWKAGWLKNAGKTRKSKASTPGGGGAHPFKYK
jgi:hypothetical protein